MSNDTKRKSPLQQALNQIKFDTKEDEISPDASFEPNDTAFDQLSELALKASWVQTYRKYRKPKSTKAWQWSPESRPGKHCDAHLIDFFSCLDNTRHLLDSDEPPEKYCLASRDLTAACMASTLCETKIYGITEDCQELGKPDLRSESCWKKLWAASNCVQHCQLLLSKQFWASRPGLVSTAERYMLLLGSPYVPGKPYLAPEHIQRRKEFLDQSLETESKYEPGDFPYYRA